MARTSSASTRVSRSRSARERLGPDRAVQGNLDPARLLAGRDAVTSGVTDVLDANGGASGHVFNTGGPIARQTDPAVLRLVVDMVHERTARSEASADGQAQEWRSRRDDGPWQPKRRPADDLRIARRRSMTLRAT